MKNKIEGKKRVSIVLLTAFLALVLLGLPSPVTAEEHDPHNQTEYCAEPEPKALYCYEVYALVNAPPPYIDQIGLSNCYGSDSDQHLVTEETFNIYTVGDHLCYGEVQNVLEECDALGGHDHF